MTAIDRVLAIAANEIGYLEKKSNSDLYDKTANAGYNNFTKYWAEIKPSYQGQPWCACFITWCLVQAFGKDIATKLLGHYPFVYVPDLAFKFTRHANPQRGDIVCYYKGGEFCHTGFVENVDGDKFITIEGNTSGASGIVANGGGVCRKTNYNSKLPGTKFIRPDYAKYIKEDEEMTRVRSRTRSIRAIVRTSGIRTSVSPPLTKPSSRALMGMPTQR